MPQDKLTNALMNRPALQPSALTPAQQEQQDEQARQWQEQNLGPTKRFLGGILEGAGGMDSVLFDPNFKQDAEGRGRSIGEILPDLLGIGLFRSPGVAASKGRLLVEDAKEAGAPEHIVKALEFAQQRWPRLFGHLDHIVPISGAAGVSGPGNFGGATKTSIMGINPDDATTVADAAKTIGHELSHTADRLVNPNADAVANYVQNKLPNGYFGNSSEIRARLQGERMKNYMQGFDRRSKVPITGPNSDATSSYIPLAASPLEQDAASLDSRISGLPPSNTPTPSAPIQSTEDKLYNLIRDRQQNPTPRVPQPGEDRYRMAEKLTPMDEGFGRQQTQGMTNTDKINWMKQNQPEKPITFSQGGKDIPEPPKSTPAQAFDEYGHPVESPMGFQVHDTSPITDLWQYLRGNMPIDQFTTSMGQKLGMRAFGDILNQDYQRGSRSVLDRAFYNAPALPK